MKRRKNLTAYTLAAGWVSSLCQIACYNPSTENQSHQGENAEGVKNFLTRICLLDCVLSPQSEVLATPLVRQRG